MKKFVLTILVLFVMPMGWQAYAQTQTVSGTVVDNAGAPIPYASVFVDGTSAGTITDPGGKFTLRLPANTTEISASCMGYESVNLPVPERGTELRIVLQSAAVQMDGVVVTGMVQMDRRLFTGATSKLSSDDIKLDGLSDVSRALEGRSAGVSVQNLSGTFGTAPKIRVRGATSIFGASKPLWVVDGIVMDDVTDISNDDLASGDAVTMISSAIAGLNADDIESFQILKDGSATSIYGARAMAGVIVVTTKKGRAGVTRINYTGEFTMRLKPSYGDYDIMNSFDQMSVYQDMENKGWLNFATTYRARNSGVFGKMYKLINTYDPVKGQFMLDNSPSARSAYLQEAEVRNTDWFDLLFKTSVMQSHSMSVSSGNEKSTSYYSISYLNDPGWYERSNVERYTGNANISYNLRKNIQLNSLVNVSYRKQFAPGSLAQDYDAVNGEVKRDFDINPFSYAINSSRTLDKDEYYTRNYADFNIFNELRNNYIELDMLSSKFQAELKWDILPGLSVSALGAMKYSTSSQQYHTKDHSNVSMAYRAMNDATIRNRNPWLYTDPDLVNTLPVSVLENGGIFEKREYKNRGFDFRTSATWNKTYGNHILNLYGGLELSDLRRTDDWFQGWGMLYEAGEFADFNYLAFKKMQEDNNPYYELNNTRRRNAAYFGTATYSWKGKYVATGTFRYEGSNRLGKSRSARWLPTWNAALAWNVHEENWFSGVSNVISNLMLKASYSLTASAGPDWVANSSMIINSYSPWRLFATDKETGLQVTDYTNRDLTYEKKHEFNFGMNMGFLDGRINMEMDVYKRNNYDLIGRTNTQGTTGTISRYANVADMESKGVEFSLSTANIHRKDFTWRTDFNFAWSKNEITNLSTTVSVMNLVYGSSYSLEGYPVGALFSIPFKGLDGDGLPMFNFKEVHVDQRNYSNLDFQSTTKHDFLKYEGPIDPTITGGFNNTFRWKGLTFNFFITYAFGNKIRLYPSYSYSYSDLNASATGMKNRWMVPGDEAHTTVPVIASYYQANRVNRIRRAYSAYNFSDEMVADGGFIRMKEIALSYELPRALLEKINVHNLSLKLSSTNPFLIYSDKKLNGQDPEYFATGGVSSPMARQFTFTVRFGF